LNGTSTKNTTGNLGTKGNEPFGKSGRKGKVPLERYLILKEANYYYVK